MCIRDSDRTICIGDKEKTVSLGTPEALPEEAAASDQIDMIQLRPHEVILAPGQTQEFTVVAFDKNGRQIKTMAAESLTVGDSLAGYRRQEMC